VYGGRFCIALAQALAFQGMAMCERLRSDEQWSISSAPVRRPPGRAPGLKGQRQMAWAFESTWTQAQALLSIW